MIEQVIGIHFLGEGFDNSPVRVVKLARRPDAPLEVEVQTLPTMLELHELVPIYSREIRWKKNDGKNENIVDSSAKTPYTVSLFFPAAQFMVLDITPEEVEKEIRRLAALDYRFGVVPVADYRYTRALAGRRARYEVLLANGLDITAPKTALEAFSLSPAMITTDRVARERRIALPGSVPPGYESAAYCALLALNRDSLNLVNAKNFSR